MMHSLIVTFATHRPLLREVAELVAGRRRDRVYRRVVERHMAVSGAAAIDPEVRPGPGPHFGIAGIVRDAPRPMVLRGGWFVLTMMLLRLTQKLCQRRDVQIAESTSEKARCDLLEQPGVDSPNAGRRSHTSVLIYGVSAQGCRDERSPDLRRMR